MAELDITPTGLEYIVEQALKREKASLEKRRILGIPAGNLATRFAGLLFLVNLFARFAADC